MIDYSFLENQSYVGRGLKIISAIHLLVSYEDINFSRNRFLSCIVLLISIKCPTSIPIVLVKDTAEELLKRKSLFSYKGKSS